MSVARLEELLTSVSGRTVSKESFIISEPTPSDDNRIVVTLKPKAHTGIYGTSLVSLKRLDLAASATLRVPFTGQQSVHDLIRQGVLGAYTTYYLRSSHSTRASMPRLLKVDTDDVFDDPIRVVSNNTSVIIRATPQSYCFFGQKEIFLQI